MNKLPQKLEKVKKFQISLVSYLMILKYTFVGAKVVLVEMLHFQILCSQELVAKGHSRLPKF